jgi:hypothetical protein
MQSKKNEDSSKVTPSKALGNLMEMFDLQTKRINVMEQQFLSLSVRVSGIEGSKNRNHR